MSSAAGAAERGGGSSPSAVNWSGSHGNVHGKPRQTSLDKLHGRKAYLVKDEWALTICEMIDKIAWPKQPAENDRTGYGLTVGPCGEFCVGDPRALNSKVTELVRAVNSALAECLPKTFEWTSLQIDVDSVISDQFNSHQIGQVACVLFGDFAGGCFHYFLRGGSARSHSSVDLVSTDRVVFVDAGQYHFSDEFTGRRLGIMAYNHVCSDAGPQDVKSALCSLGFRSRKLGSLPVPPVGSGSLSPAVSGSLCDGESRPLAVPGVGHSEVRDLDMAEFNKHNLADFDRMLIELCTNEDSKLGESTQSSEGCLVVRVTIKHDLTTERGVQFVLQVISAWCSHRRLIGAKVCLLLWISIPCTGGSPWNRQNKTQSKETRDKIKAHVCFLNYLRLLGWSLRESLTSGACPPSNGPRGVTIGSFK